MTIRVLVADDQDLVRTGLCLILGTLDGIEVVGEARDGQEAVRLARELRPDVRLMDIRMPVLDGVEATRQLAGPTVEDPIAVVVITTFDLDEYVHGALRAGATGFLLKDAGPAMLGEAIRAATRGDSLISPSITRRLLSSFARNGRGEAPIQPIDPLTEREEQVLLTIARGRTECRDRRRAAHQPEHGEDPRRQPDGQARRPEQGGGRHVGLRDRPGQRLTTDDERASIPG